MRGCLNNSVYVRLSGRCGSGQTSVLYERGGGGGNMSEGPMKLRGAGPCGLADSGREADGFS